MQEVRKRSKNKPLSEEKEMIMDALSQQVRYGAKSDKNVFRSSTSASASIREDQDKDDAVFSSFVLLNEDGTELELFLPGEDRTSVILSSSDQNIYTNGAYEYDSSDSTLYIDGEASYSTQE